MKILVLDDDQRLAEYNHLAEQVGSVFDTVDWLRLVADMNSVKICGIFDNNDDLLGGFYLFEERKYGVTICRQAPFTPTNGPFLRQTTRNPVAVMDFSKRVLSLIADFIGGMNYAVVAIALDKSVVDTQPFIWASYKAIVRYTYVLELDASVEQLKQNMSSKRRNNLTKARRDGINSVLVESGNQSVRSLILRTFSRQRMRIDEGLLERILSRARNSFAFMSFKDGSPIACAFCIHDRKTAYYLAGGYDADNGHHGAGSLSTWESIKHARHLGLRFFDFEGSSVPSIEKYFRGFGGALTPYYRINKAKLPLEILLKFFKRSLF